MKFEQDEVELTGGVRHGRTLGGPIAIRVGNTEWPKWETVMSADPVDAAELAGQARNAPLTRPRPGHADLAGMQKYGFDDARPSWSGPAPGRRPPGSRSARWRGGCSARRSASDPSATWSRSARCGSRTSVVPGPDDAAAIDADPVRCLDAETSAAMVAEIDAVAQGRRHPRRGGRGAGLRPAARPRQLHVTGTGGWTAGWPAR